MWKARINLGFETGRKPVHLPIPQSGPPSWAHLFLMNSHGHRWTHTQIDGDTHTQQMGGFMCAFTHGRHTHTHNVSILAPFLSFCVSVFSQIWWHCCPVEHSSYEEAATSSPNLTRCSHTHTHTQSRGWIWKHFSCSVFIRAIRLRKTSGSERRSLICRKAFWEEKA